MEHHAPLFEFMLVSGRTADIRIINMPDLHSQIYEKEEFEWFDELTTSRFDKLTTSK
jgi:hypothetical protein